MNRKFVNLESLDEKWPFKNRNSLRPIATKERKNHKISNIVYFVCFVCFVCFVANDSDSVARDR